MEIITKLTTGIIALVMILAIVLAFCGFRLDFASGAHKITPTAIDNDFWGNYTVYFKTSEYTQNSQEDTYCISKNDKDLAEQMQEIIREGKDAMVYYEKYIGFKGISSCDKSPITKIEVLD